MVAYLVVATALLLMMAPALRNSFAISIKVVVLGYLLIGPLGFLEFYDSPVLTSKINYAPISYLQSISFTRAVLPFVTCAVSVALGAVAVIVVSGTRGERTSSRAGAQAANLLRLTPNFVWLGAIAIALEVAGVGPQTILSSSAYLHTSGPRVLVSLASIISPIAVVVCANVAGSQTRAMNRGVAVVMLIIIEVMYFGQATRLFAIFPALVFTGVWLTGVLSRTKVLLYGAISFALAVPLLNVPIALRGQQQHGLVPAINYLFTNPSGLIAGSGLLSNVLLGVPITLYVGYAVPRIPDHVLVTSLNPAPGGFTDWSSLSPQLRLNIFEPFSAIGELMNYGWVYLVAVMIGIGAAFQALSVISRAARAEVRAGLDAVVLAGAALFLIRSTQYNLRSDMRLVYYQIFVVCLVSAVSQRRANDHVVADDRVPSRGIFA